jgi:hypothetical protein
MPLAYYRDDVKRCVVATVTGPFESADVIALLERQRDDGTWAYRLLLDTSGMSGRPSFDDLREFMRLEKETDSEERPRGPLAIFATDVTIYATACVYAALGGSKRRVEVFRSRDEANQWLSAQVEA